MSLTSRERKTLLAYQKFREKLPTISLVWKRMVPRFVFLALLPVIAYFFTFELVTIFIAGMVIGGLLRQLSILWTSTKVLPILIKVIDWDLVDQLLETPTEGKA